MHLRLHLCWIAAGLVCAQITASRVLAQSLTVDGTLSTSVTSPDGKNFTITEGNRVGGNLFHSFEQFSVPTGGSAVFNNAGDIQNIISRVTGASASNINGLISAQGNANLFLINPNGIVFGPHASLSIGGSFLASTASSIKLADGTKFSATNPQAPPLLTVSAPIGLGFGPKAEPIVNRSQVPGSYGITAGLKVQLGQTIALVGGDILLEGGGLNATDGRIELGSVADNSFVRLISQDKGWTMGYEGVQNFKDIFLTQTSAIDTSGSGGGNIQIQGRNVSLKDGSVIYANTLGANSGGNISVKASESLELIGTNPEGYLPSSLFASVQAGATGNGGDVTIETNRLRLLDGGELGTGTWSSGNAGDLNVLAKDIEITGASAPYFRYPSGFFTRVQNRASGHGGNLTITTDRLRLADGARIEAGTLGSGDAGDVSVQAKDIELVGTLGNEEFPDLFPTTLVTQVNSKATGRGGDLEITTDRLKIRNGAAIQSNTYGAGNAGNLRITASESVEVAGMSRYGKLSSSLLAGSESDFAAGSVRIATGALSVRDGAEISVSNLGAGGAGNLSVLADSLVLDNASSLSAQVQAGNKGNINIEVKNLQLLRGSTITTEASGIANGGNLTINANTLVISDSSNIRANAFQGSGGNIQLATFGLFSSPDAIIASSVFGVDGLVEIQAPDFESGSALSKLPQTVVDVTFLINQACSSDSGNTESTFVMTGRGGMPPNPNSTLASETVLADLGSAALQHKDSGEIAIRPTHQSAREIIEANSWIINKDGQIILTSSASDAYEPMLLAAACWD